MTGQPRQFGGIYTSIWKNPDFIARSSNAQRAYFMLISQPEINAAGVQTLAMKRWSRYSPEGLPALQEAMRELVEHRFVVVDLDTEEVLVRSFIKWDNKGYANVKRRGAIVTAWSNLASNSVRDLVSQQMRDLGHPIDLENRVSDRVSDALSQTGPQEPQPQPQPQPQPREEPPAPPSATKNATTEATPKSIRKPLDPEYQITEAMASWAKVTHMLNDEAIDAETEKFIDHHLAAGTKWVDWDRAWRNWIRRAVEYAKGVTPISSARSSRGAPIAVRSGKGVEW